MLTETDIDILEALDNGDLSVGELVRTLHKLDSAEIVEDSLKDLNRQDYVVAYQGPADKRWYYTLTHKGRKEIA